MEGFELVITKENGSEQVRHFFTPTQVDYYLEERFEASDAEKKELWAVGSTQVGLNVVSLQKTIL